MMHLSTTAWTYWLAVVGSAAGALTVSAPALTETDGWGRFAILTAAASVAQLSAVKLTRRRVFHPAIVFVVAGALLLTPEQLVFMCVLQHVPDWFKHRYSWYIQPFNVANYVLAGGCAALAARAVPMSAGFGSRVALVGIVAVFVFVGVNRVLLAGMLSLGRGLRVRASGLFGGDDLALELVLAAMAVPSRRSERTATLSPRSPSRHSL